MLYVIYYRYYIYIYIYIYIYYIYILYNLITICIIFYLVKDSINDSVLLCSKTYFNCTEIKSLEYSL